MLQVGDEKNGAVDPKDINQEVEENNGGNAEESWNIANNLEGETANNETRPANEALDETIYRRNNPDEPTSIEAAITEEQWNKMHSPTRTNHSGLKQGWREV